MGILWLVASYIIGSIPFGLVIAKIFCKIDIQQEGSKSTGSTNVARLCGFKFGVLTLICDLSKGAFCIYLARIINPEIWFWSAAGFLVLCGHTWSIFLKFKGGKAVASTVGIFLIVAPVQLIASAIVGIVVIWRFGFVSLGSLTITILLPILILFSQNKQALPLALAVLCLVLYTHRENIKRLKNGTEKTWKKPKT